MPFVAQMCAWSLLAIGQPQPAVVDVPNGHCLRPELSADARFVVFDSMATNLVPEDTTPLFDVYLHDRANKTTQLVSRGLKGSAGDGAALEPSISADGRFVVFQSDAPDLAAADSNGFSDLFLFDAKTRELTRLPIAGAGQEANGHSRRPRISANGRFVAFESMASNLIAADSNNSSDIFVFDRDTGLTQRVSEVSAGGEVSWGSTQPDISADGRFVVFTSVAGDLAPDDNNECADVFLHDRQTRETLAVSVTPDGKTGNLHSQSARISGDGSTVVFESWASDLCPGPESEGSDVFVFNVASRKLTCLSRSPEGLAATANSYAPAVSADGKSIVFLSLSDNFGPGNLKQRVNIFLARIPASGLQLVSKTTSGSPAEADCGYPAIAPDGRTVAFSTKAGGFLETKLKEATVLCGSLDGPSFEAVSAVFAKQQ